MLKQNWRTNLGSATLLLLYRYQIRKNEVPKLLSKINNKAADKRTGNETT
jgi:hypothetical protein